MSQMIEKIAVLGSGMQLAMSVAILAHSLKPFNVKVAAVEVPEENSDSSVEVCGPEFSPLCAILGLNEVEILRKCAATFRLGDSYSVNEQQWFVPFAHMGLSAKQDDFEQGLFQYLASQQRTNIAPYCTAASAAAAGKFAIAGHDRADLRAALEYGVQLDKQKYLACLTAAVQHLNVEKVGLHSADIRWIGEQHLSEVRCAEQRVKADFWIDVRQSKPLPANLTPDSKSSSKPVNELLPITHTGEWSSPQFDLTKPYTQFKRLKNAWLRIIYLRERTIYKILITNESLDLAQVSDELRLLGISLPDDLPLAKVMSHVEQTPWQKNVLTLGHQSVCLGDFMFSELQLLQSALVQFLDVLPSLPIGQHNRAAYNQEWQKFIQEAQDYSSLHFALHNGDYSALPQSLTERIQVFERLGRLSPILSDAATEGQWYHMLYGIGLRPQLHSAVLSKVSGAELEAGIHKVQHSMSGLVAGMPSHEQYLHRFYPLFSV
ncbi:tryptophan 7-halogenase [Paraglaciecola aquimarina]|uniref:Tryptophan 7-halogenase n=1 Tax=Paraglaciecola aquimarina TaxID=1235557 RepID=A0ABU3SRV5_9ALTE|nr:tryptophan 7-halogenase [Paraglaciecola aquimarina]MDU0352745.1 tryptophan 7-halogenase [Paraglaciecola aquimarina]